MPIFTCLQIVSTITMLTEVTSVYKQIIIHKNYLLVMNISIFFIEILETFIQRCSVFIFTTSLYMLNQKMYIYPKNLLYRLLNAMGV